jgi:hypothetical protein
MSSGIRYAACTGHHHGFLHRARDDIPGAFDLQHRSVGDARHGRKRVEGAVCDQLAPLRHFYVVGDRRPDAGRVKHLRQRFARGSGADRDVSAAVMPDVSGPGHFAADIDHRWNDGVAGELPETLWIVDAVLQAENRCLPPQTSGQGPAGFLGIGRLDAEQHQVRRGEGGCVRSGLRGQVSLEELRVQQQPMRVDGVDMRWPADERHVMSCPEQQPPIVTPDGSRPDDRDLHACLLDSAGAVRSS